MKKSALIWVSSLLLAGCASSDQTWQDKAPRDGVQYQGQSLNSPVSDQSFSAGHSLNDDGARMRNGQ